MPGDNCPEGGGFIGKLEGRFRGTESRIDSLLSNGAGGLYKGPWQSGVQYSVDETVEFNGTLYRSKTDNNSEVPPGASWATVLQSDYGYYIGEDI